MKSGTSEIGLRNIFKYDDFDPFTNLDLIEKKSPEDIFPIDDEVYGNILFPSFEFIKNNVQNKFQSEYGNSLKKELEAETPNVTTKADLPLIKEKAMQNYDGETNQPEISYSLSNIKHAVGEVKSLQASNEVSEDESKHEDDPDYEPNFLINQISGLISKKNRERIRLEKFETLNKIRSSNPKRRKEIGVKLSRWNRETDRKAYAFLREELSKINMSLEEFLFNENSDIADDFNHEILCRVRHDILDKICIKLQWLNTHYFLFKRLKNLSMKQSFSFRETKLLRSVPQ